MPAQIDMFLKHNHVISGSGIFIYYDVAEILPSRVAMSEYTI